MWCFSVDNSTKVAVVALIIMGLSVSIAIVYPIYALQVAQTNYEPYYSLSAHRLAEKPETFIHMDNPDPYVSQVISEPNKTVIVNQKDTQINDLIRERGTNNFEVNGSYYQIYIASVDAFPPEILNAPKVVILSFIALVMSVIVFIIALAVKGKKRIKAKSM